MSSYCFPFHKGRTPPLPGRPTRDQNSPSTRNPHRGTRDRRPGVLPCLSSFTSSRTRVQVPLLVTVSHVMPHPMCLLTEINGKTGQWCQSTNLCRNSPRGRYSGQPLHWVLPTPPPGSSTHPTVRRQGWGPGLLPDVRARPTVGAESTPLGPGPVSLALLRLLVPPALLGQRPPPTPTLPLAVATGRRSSTVAPRKSTPVPTSG